MSEAPTASIAGLVSAGAGTRLRAGLIETGEVYQDGNAYRFMHNGELFEKALTYLVPPDPNVEGDQGVVVLDLAVKDILLIPEVQTLRILTNEQSNIPHRYGETIDRAAFLRRLGLPALQGDGISPLVTIEYYEQPTKSEEYPFYGTAWAFHLISQGVELDENELMMITETDSAFLHPQGISVPARMIEALRVNRRGATSALSVAAMDPNTSPANGLGMVLMEPDGAERYFQHVIESEGHADLDEARASGLLIGRNTTRVAADAAMLAMNQVTVNTPPSEANNNEYQATDSYNARAELAPLLAFTNPEGVEWRDIGKLPGLLAVRAALGGLRDAQSPVWGPAKAA